MVTVIVLLVLGVAAARIRSLPDRTPQTLDWLVLWVALPGLILDQIPELDLELSAVVPVVVAWGTLVLLAVLLFVLAGIRRWDRRVTGTMLLVVCLGNTSFLGIPAVQATLGADHVPTALVYDQFGTFIGLVTWGSFVAARYGSGARPSVGTTIRRVLAFPPFLALVAAFVLRSVDLPSDVDGVFTEVVASLGAMLVPLSMLAVGMRLTLPRSWRTVEPLAFGLVLRMAVAPAAAYGAAVLLGGDGLAWETSIVEASMPPMVTASVIAAAVGLDDELGSALVGLGVLVSLVSAPFWANLITAL